MAVQLTVATNLKDPFKTMMEPVNGLMGITAFVSENTATTWVVSEGGYTAPFTGTGFTYTNVLGLQVLSNGEINAITKGGETLGSLTGMTLDACDYDIWGSAHQDRLYGGKGNDLLRGDAGNGILTGARGDDTPYGGAGADKLTFATGFGTDHIHDRQDGLDRLDFDYALVDKIKQRGDDVKITDDFGVAIIPDELASHITELEIV